MNLAEQIEDALRQQQRQGKTQTEMSELNGISQSHIQRILSNPETKIKGLKVETLMRMFPRATLNLNGDTSLTQNGANNVGVNNGTLKQTAPSYSQAQIREAVEAFRHRVSDSLLNIDIPPDALLKVLKTIKELAQ